MRDNSVVLPKVHRSKSRQELLHNFCDSSSIQPEATQARPEIRTLKTTRPTTTICVSSSHGRSLLRPLVERFHSCGGHSQWQRCIKATQLQLYQLETLCSSEIFVRKQIIKLTGRVDRAVVFRRMPWTKGSCELGIVPIRQLVVSTGKWLVK